MSCYCKAHNLLKVCICCQSLPGGSNCPPQAHQTQSDNLQISKQIQQIQKNYANILSKQLEQLSKTKQRQIQNLEQTISKLKIQLLKLENRNKLDKDNEIQLKLEIKKLNNKIKQLLQLLNKQKYYDGGKKQDYYFSKQIIQKNNKNSNNTNDNYQNLHKQIDDLKAQIVQLKSKIYQLQEINKDLKDKLNRVNDIKDKKINELTNKIRQLQEQLNGKNQQIQQLSNEKISLFQKINHLSSKPTKLPIEPIIINKVITQPPEIRTVYVDRPVEKTKIIQVQKVVRSFIQPQRPVLNRIINCPPSKKCKCESERSYSEKREIEEEEYQLRENAIESQYKQVLNSYKNERQKLVNLIQERDSDYHLLQKKVQLCQNLNARSVPIPHCNHPSTVEVTVYKNGQKVEQPNSKRHIQPEQKKTVPFQQHGSKQPNKTKKKS